MVQRTVLAMTWAISLSEATITSATSGGIKLTKAPVFICPCCGSLHTATNCATNLARCFECRKNFNPIDMVMTAGKCNFVEAVKYMKRVYLQKRSSQAEQDG